MMYFRRLQLQKHPADDARRPRGGTRTLFKKKNMSSPSPPRRDGHAAVQQDEPEYKQST